MSLARRCIPLALATLLLLPSSGRAGITLSVSLNTQPLADTLDSFALAFTLLPGSELNNTTATLSNFNFGGGGPDGSPELVGGASGDLSSSVTLTTSTGFNDFVQGFIPGSTLSFLLTISSQAVLETPDTFAFSILDGTGLPIPTLAPSTPESGTDSLLSVVTSSITTPMPQVSSFGTDPEFTSINLGSPGVAVVPEPSSLMMTALAGLTIASGRGLRWIRRRTGAAGG